MTKKMGRPKTEIDWTEFEKLCSYQCTLEEVAHFFNCNPKTIERHVEEHYGMTFVEVLNKNKSFGKVKLRKAMMELALSGDKVMLIWLSKQYLGMKDKQEDVSPEIMAYVQRAIQLLQMPKEQLKEFGKELVAEVVPIHGKA